MVRTHVCSWTEKEHLEFNHRPRCLYMAQTQRLTRFALSLKRRDLYILVGLLTDALLLRKLVQILHVSCVWRNLISLLSKCPATTHLLYFLLGAHPEDLYHVGSATLNGSQEPLRGYHDLRLHRGCALGQCLKNGLSTGQTTNSPPRK